MRRFALAFLLASACAPTTTAVAPTNPAPRPLAARPVSEVQVFVGRRPEAAHVDVAILQPPQVGSFGADLAGVVASLRTAAATAGCDGVVVYGGASVWGSCIAFVEAPVPAPAAPASAIAAAPAPVVPVAAPAPARPAAPPAAPAPAIAAPVASPPPPPASPAAAGVVLARVFVRLDRDHNGRLNAEEVPASMGPILRRIDSNHDGWVTRDELGRFNAAPPSR